MQLGRTFLASVGLIACAPESTTFDSTAGATSTSTTAGMTSTAPTTGEGIPGEWRGILGPAVWITDDAVFQECTSSQSWELLGVVLSLDEGTPVYIEIAGVEQPDFDGDGTDEIVVSELLAGPCDPKTCAPIMPGAECSGCYGPCPGTVMGCDEWAQDCGPGEKCVPYSRWGTPVYDSLRCVPVVPDPAAPGEDCAVQGHPTSGFDNCDAQSVCWEAVPTTLAGECVAMCIGDEESPTCSAPPLWCATGGDVVLHLCFPDCDPLEPNCDPDELCVPNGLFFRCTRDKSGTGGQLFDVCDDIAGCDPGLLCMDPGAASECEVGSSGCCVPYCDLDAPVCPGIGQECLAWYSPPNSAPSGLENVGVCRVP